MQNTDAPTNGRPNKTAQRLHAYLASVGAQGATGRQIQDATNSGRAMAGCLCRQAQKGNIGRHGSGKKMRYFATQAMADAWIPPPKPAKTERQRWVETCAAVKQQVEQAGDSGTTTRLIAAAVIRDESTVRNCIRLAKIGHSLKIGYLTLHFATQAQANAYANRPAAFQHPRIVRKPNPPRKPAAALPAPAAKALPAPVQITPTPLQGQAKWGENMRVTIAPTPKPRISTEGAEMLFSTKRPGVYLQAETWASRAFAR